MCKLKAEGSKFFSQNCFGQAKNKWNSALSLTKAKYIKELIQKSALIEPITEIENQLNSNVMLSEMKAFEVNGSAKILQKCIELGQKLSQKFPNNGKSSGRFGKCLIWN